MSFRARDIRLLTNQEDQSNDVVVEATRQALENEDHILLYEIVRWLKREHRIIQEKYSQ